VTPGPRLSEAAPEKRPTLDQMNSDDLDALHERAEKAEADANHTADLVADTVQRAERAEAAIARVRALHVNGYGLCDECTGSHGAPWPCPTIRALDEPTPSPAATQATQPREHCGHTIDGGFGRPLGPCLRTPGHPELFHRDANGTEWRPARSAVLDKTRSGRPPACA
jgi:hypothetical protein